MMKKKALCYLVFVLLAAALSGCSSTHQEWLSPPETPPVSNIKIRVVDVSNDTRELYEVDVIGMMWTALDDALRKRGMLWTPDAPGLPLMLEAHVLKYQEGSVWLRPILPMWGKTVLTLKGDLKEGGQVVASAETQQAMSFGHGTFTIGAWRKIFAGAAEEFVSQLVRGL
jgi:hypothetical protein